MTKAAQTTFNGHHNYKYLDTRPGDICGVTGAGHNWQCAPYCRGISRGVCACGAVRFFAVVVKDEYLKLRDHYNAKHGKAGKAYNGPPRTNNSHGILQTKTKKEEENMAAQIPAKELPDTMKEELGINKQGTALVDKPDTKTPPKEYQGIPIRANKDAYTRDEKRTIAGMSKGATKEERKKIAGIFHITPIVLHGWEAVFNSQIHKNKKADASPPAAPLTTKAEEIANKPAPEPEPPATVEEKLYCPPGCTLKNNPCFYGSMCRGFMPDAKATPTDSFLYSVCGNYTRHKPEPPAEKTITSTIEYSIDTAKLDAQIKDLHAKLTRLNDLKTLVLPPFRWWFILSPTLVRHYFSALREIVNK